MDHKLEHDAVDFLNALRQIEPELAKALTGLVDTPENASLSQLQRDLTEIKLLYLRWPDVFERALQRAWPLKRYQRSPTNCFDLLEASGQILHPFGERTGGNFSGGV